MSKSDDLVHPVQTLAAIWQEHGQSEQRLALSLYSLGVTDKVMAELWKQANTLDPERWMGLADHLATSRRRVGEPVHDYPVLNEVLRACTDPGETCPQEHNLAMALRGAKLPPDEVHHIRESGRKAGDFYLLADRLAMALEKTGQVASYDAVRELRGGTASQGEFATIAPVRRPKTGRAEPKTAAAPVPPPVPAPLGALPSRPDVPSYLQGDEPGEAENLGEGLTQ